MLLRGVSVVLYTFSYITASTEASVVERCKERECIFTLEIYPSSCNNPRNKKFCEKCQKDGGECVPSRNSYAGLLCQFFKNEDNEHLSSGRDHPKHTITALVKGRRQSAPVAPVARLSSAVHSNDTTATVKETPTERYFRLSRPKRPMFKETTEEEV